MADRDEIKNMLRRGREKKKKVKSPEKHADSHLDQHVNDHPRVGADSNSGIPAKKTPGKKDIRSMLKKSSVRKSSPPPQPKAEHKPLKQPKTPPRSSEPEPVQRPPPQSSQREPPRQPDKQNPPQTSPPKPISTEPKKGDFRDRIPSISFGSSGGTSESKFPKWIKKPISIVVIILIIIVAATGTFLYVQPHSAPENSTVYLITTLTATITGPGGTITLNEVPMGTGSGFIITSDGYIATAAHVAGDSSQEGVIEEWTDERIKAFLMKELKEYAATEGFTLSNDIKITNTKINVKVRGKAFPDSDKEAEIIAVGDAENDIALLKIDDVSDLPYIPLSSSETKVEDKVKIFGFPRAQFAGYNDSDIVENKNIPNSMFTPTVTDGVVSGERSYPSGFKYYQTTAPVTHGTSGGPVCNSNNQAIGILVAGVEETQGFNFFIPISNLITMCEKNGVELPKSMLPF